MYFALILLLIGLCYSQSTPYSGAAWETLTNDQKMAALTVAITNDTTSGSFPSILEDTVLFIEDMNLSFDTVADDMPYQFIIPTRREKLVHSVGVIAPAVWTPVANNLGYTGILDLGCTDLFVRLSVARDPSPTTNSSYTPGLAIKCLRSGIPSANVFAMYSLQGQVSWNFFKHDLTNHVPDLSSNAPFILQELRSTFAKASNWPVMIGISDLAQYDQAGNPISSPVFPFRLVFHPTTALHNQFPDTPQTPFQDVLEAGLQNPGDMYSIYAVVNPGDTNDQFVQIGTITTTGPATTSNFGDVFMFFEHVRMENDFQFRPDWADPATQIMANQRAIDDYTYPDLPFN